MDSRDTILKKLKANKPEFIALPKINLDIFDENIDMVKEFIRKVEVAGGKVFEVTDNKEVLSKTQEAFPDTKVNFTNLDDSGFFNTIDSETLKNPHKLNDLDVLVLESTLGVAENGAVWLTDNDIPVRVIPFITKHLVLVLPKENIVPYMHQAYSVIDPQVLDYGIFISGPSKTADIEQSLVIGAQGAMSLTVFLV
ncbi:LutC/YkgG family protein [Maribacter polysiphoniae]|uniref:LutC/YkgG family protein n=1 Tax=Maribacter polysiphoniae TaxID=429344 RepID=UPI0023562BF9|nr:LUD domain-containing protein [Maribacter polysiphoniae]